MMQKLGSEKLNKDSIKDFPEYIKLKFLAIYKICQNIEYKNEYQFLTDIYKKIKDKALIKDLECGYIYKLFKFILDNQTKLKKIDDVKDITRVEDIPYIFPNSILSLKVPSISAEYHYITCSIKNKKVYVYQSFGSNKPLYRLKVSLKDFMKLLKSYFDGNVKNLLLIERKLYDNDPKKKILEQEFYKNKYQFFDDIKDSLEDIEDIEDIKDIKKNKDLINFIKSIEKIGYPKIYINFIKLIIIYFNNEGYSPRDLYNIILSIFNIDKSHIAISNIINNIINELNEEKENFIDIQNLNKQDHKNLILLYNILLPYLKKYTLKNIYERRTKNISIDLTQYIYNPDDENILKFKAFKRKSRRVSRRFSRRVSRRISRQKTPRKMSKSYCKKTPCNKMGFSQKASCRPYKNCYKK
jgi:hypothetical protein